MASFLHFPSIMKPQPLFPDARRRSLPLTDFCFQSDLGGWRGASWPDDNDEDSPARRFNELNREFLRESRRERQREVIVFGFVMLIAAWPVVYLVYTVIRFLLRVNPFDH
jgi:hypothetical protein